MANRLVSIERQPAMQMTPEDFEARMTAAAARARRDDEVLIVAAKRERGEAIRDLSKLRDQVLAKKWNDDKWNRGVQELKDKVTDLLDKAANKSSTGDEL